MAVGNYRLSRGSCRTESRSPTLQMDSLSPEPPWKPKNAGVGSLSFLQRIFLNQEWNHSLLNCSNCFYKLCYPGSPVIIICEAKK